MRWLAAGWLAALVACSGDPTAPDAGTPDAGEPDGGDVEPDAGPALDPPAPPALPEPPRIAPCPEGWREAGEGDEIWCDPWPEGGRPECPADQEIFPGEPGCSDIGAPCPADGVSWPEELPDDGTVLFVLAPDGDPVVGGAGTRASPFQTIAEAVTAAGPGTTIALSRGTFHEIAALTEGVTLRGACVGATLLDPPLPAGGGSVQVFGTGVVVRDLQVGGEGIWVRPAGAVDLQGVLASDTELFGVVVDTGELTGSRIVVRGPHGADFGIGLHVQLGRADVHQVVLERCQTMGLSVLAAPSVSVTDLVVRDTALGVTDDLGIGIAAGQGGVADVERAVLEHNQTAGAFVQDHDTTLHLADALVRDTYPTVLDGDGGWGLSIFSSANAELERVVLDHNTTGALAVANGARVTARDVIVRDTAPRPTDGVAGLGIGVTSYSDFDGERIAVLRNYGAGLTVGNEGSTARFADVIVRDTEVQQSDLDGGFGLAIGEPVSVVVERALFENNTTAGIYAFQEASLTASDLTIRDTRTHPSGLLGRGLTVQDTVDAQISRAVFSRNREANVFVAGPDSHVTFEDLVVEDTLERACVDQPDGCPNTGAGAGIVSVLTADVDVRRFITRRNAICGVQIARDGTIALHDGEVYGNPIGANVQVDGFDFARLQDRVLFHDNGRNLDSSVLAVPDPNFSR